jgi:lysophospholipase L1-like esterase
MYIMFVTLALLVIVLGYGGIMGRRLWHADKVSKLVISTTVPFQRPHNNTRTHILVLGDSTMYGAGVKNRANTMGGLLATKYPVASIETLAVNGAKVKDLRDQIGQAQFRKYKLILIGIGGNDIVGLSRYDRVRQELTWFLEHESRRAETIVLFHCVNVGNIGFFVFPLNYLYSFRTKQLSKLFNGVARSFKNVLYVNFYRPMSRDYYDKKTRPEFIADDAFHPNDYANKYFFNIIWDELKNKSKTN